MADRQTTVRLDIEVGTITVPSGTLQLNATLNVAAPASTSAAAKSVRKDLENMLAPLVGPAMAGRIGAAFSRIEGGAIDAGKALVSAGTAGSVAALAIGALAVTVLAAVAAFKYLSWWSQTVLKLLGQLIDVCKAFGRALYDVNASILHFISIPLRPAVLLSVDALRWLVSSAGDAARAVFNLTVEMLKNATGVGAEFEQRVANTTTAMGTFGAAGMAMREQIAQAAVAMTAFTATLPSEAAASMWDVASAGFSKFTDLVNVSSAAITLANATLENVSDTGRILISILNQFSLSTDQSARVVNALAAAASFSATSVSMLMESMKYAGPIAAAFGMSMEATLAALGVFAQQGILQSQSGTALRNLLSNLSAGTDKAEKAFRKATGGAADLEATMTSLDRALGKGAIEKIVEQYNDFGAATDEQAAALKALGVNVEDVVKKYEALNEMGLDPQALVALRTQLKGMGLDMRSINPAFHSLVEIVRVFEGIQAKLGKQETVALIGKAFNLRSASALYALLNQGSKALVDMEKRITDTHMAYQMQADQLQTLQGAWKILLNMWQVAQLQMVNGLRPALAGIVQALQSVVQWASQSGFFSQLGGIAGSAVSGLANVIAILAGPLLAAVGPVLNYLGQAVQFVAQQFAVAAQDGLPAVTQFVQVLMGLIPRLVDDFRIFGEWFLRTGLPLFLQWAGMVGPMVVTVFENIFNAVTQLLAGGGSDLLLQWFNQLLTFGINLTAQLPSLIPNILAAGNAFMGWAGYLEQLALYLFPSLVETIGKFIPQIDALVMTYLPIFGNELFYILQVANKFADDGLPKIVEAFKKAQPEIIGFIQTVATAITQVLSAVGQAAKAVGDNIQAIRAALEPIIKFIGENAGMLIQVGLTALQVQIQMKAWGIEVQLLKLGQSGMAMQVQAQADAAIKAIGAVSSGIGGGKVPAGGPLGVTPMMAAGGPVSAGTGYIVGENGPEYFVPKSDGMIVPYGGGGGSGSAGGGARRQTSILW